MEWDLQSLFGLPLPPPPPSSTLAPPVTILCLEGFGHPPIQAINSLAQTFICTVWAWGIFFQKQDKNLLTTDALINLWDVGGFVSTSGWCTVAPGLIPSLVSTLEVSSPCLQHRKNMELDLQSFFGLHVHSCTHWLRPRMQPSRPPPIPPHLDSYTIGRYWLAKIDDISLWPPG